ncbi:MAG: zinc-ribbon domain-containing protein [Clostridiales bacterium]|nr:zinc-ribbon domain-containing protein [Clostridiales bacterium]
MFCRNCGSEINDEAVICVKCGVPVAQPKAVEEKTKKEPKPIVNVSVEEASDFIFNQKKTGLGVFAGLVMGLIGLVFMFFFPKNTLARRSFAKAYWISFGILAGVLFTILMTVAAIQGLPYYPYY